MARLLIGILMIQILSCSQKGEQDNILEVDVCVYGGTAAGVMAAYTAKKMGKSVILIEPGKYIDGMTTGGLGWTDFGNKGAVSGLALDFYKTVGKYYGKEEEWRFAPSVASKARHKHTHPLQEYYPVPPFGNRIIFGSSKFRSII